jgi:hypothetical protein
MRSKGGRDRGCGHWCGIDNGIKIEINQLIILSVLNSAFYHPHLIPYIIWQEQENSSVLKGY